MPLDIPFYFIVSESCGIGIDFSEHADARVQVTAEAKAAQPVC
jgi:hypothetical protein